MSKNTIGRLLLIVICTNNYIQHHLLFQKFYVYLQPKQNSYAERRCHGNRQKQIRWIGRFVTHVGLKAIELVLYLDLCWFVEEVCGFGCNPV